MNARKQNLKRVCSYGTTAESAGRGLPSAHSCWNISLEIVVYSETTVCILWQLDCWWFRSKCFDLYMALIWWFVKTLRGFEVAFENQRVVIRSTE